MISIDSELAAYSQPHSVLYKNPSVGTNIAITTRVGNARKHTSRNASLLREKYVGNPKPSCIRAVCPALCMSTCIIEFNLVLCNSGVNSSVFVGLSKVNSVIHAHSITVTDTIMLTPYTEISMNKP
jgi:hypothetical protein